MAKKRYLVTGSQPVYATQPGEEFEVDMPPEQEESLLSIGAIALSSDKPKEK